MKKELCILHLEDNPNDAALIEATLETGGIICQPKRVENRVDFVAALAHGGVDLVISDYSLPSFDGLSALKIVRTEYPDVPFILVSGTLGEEVAVESLKSGATDYILKERLVRLVPAIERALQETEKQVRLKKIETDLKASEKRFSSAFEYAAIGVALVGLDGKFLKVNRALSNLVGYSEDEMLTKTFQDITHPEDLATDLENVRQLVSGEVHSYQMEKRYFRKDGKIVTILLSVSLVRDLHNQPLYFISQIQDITERKLLEARFIEAQKMEVIGQLAGGVAHDFNNILGVIIGYGDLAMQELGPDSSLRVYMEEIRHAADRAAALTRQLLVFSRKQTVQPVVIDLNTVLSDMEKMLRRLIDEHIELKLVPGEKIGRVKADSGYVGQVVMNLAINGRDAMPNGGKLTIATSNVILDENYAREHAGVVPGDYVMLSISDTGIGMTDEVKSRLFEAFFTTKPKGKGTGLGLVTCQTIAKQCGGHIGVYSELGKGTTFKVYFPQVEHALDISTEFIKKGPLPRGNETILLVEDEPSVRHLASNVLETQGYTLLRANNGQDGLNMAREHKGSPIRLVITDVIMPQMGGKVMAEWLKTTYPNLKILFTSGYTDDAIAHHGVLDPGVAFLPKPYTPSALARKVREILDNHEISHGEK